MSRILLLWSVFFGPLLRYCTSLLLLVALVAPWGSWLQLIAVVSESHKLCDCVLTIDMLRAQQTNQPTCNGWCASSTASTHKQKCKRSLALSHDDVLFFFNTVWNIPLGNQSSNTRPTFCKSHKTQLFLSYFVQTKKHLKLTQKGTTQNCDIEMHCCDNGRKMHHPWRWMESTKWFACQNCKKCHSQSPFLHWKRMHFRIIFQLCAVCEQKSAECMQLQKAKTVTLLTDSWQLKQSLLFFGSKSTQMQQTTMAETTTLMCDGPLFSNGHLNVFVTW